ncbi:MAG: hypothetical protein ACREQZ_14220 [Woeseiaceae bacterium]
MALIRYGLYFLGVALLMLLLTEYEIGFPGGLQLERFVESGNLRGTSEYSAVELIQAIVLVACGSLYGWVAKNLPAQRPVALLFAALALIFLLRELDYFLDRLIAVNFWRALMAVAAALIIVYLIRARRRFRIAWLRVWPSPGLALLFAGAVLMFGVIAFVRRESLWQAILGQDYHPVVRLAVEELSELGAYALWFIGTVEYVYQARAIAMHEPQTAVARRRAGRHPKSEGRF